MMERNKDLKTRWTAPRLKRLPAERAEHGNPSAVSDSGQNNKS